MVTNPESVEVLRKNYKLGEIVNFSVVQLEPEKKRYILDLIKLRNKDNNSSNSPSQLGNCDDENKENKMKYTWKLNVCEKSFYPQSYLKMVSEQNNSMNNNTEEVEKNDNEQKKNEISIYNKDISLNQKKEFSIYEIIEDNHQK